MSATALRRGGLALAVLLIAVAGRAQVLPRIPVPEPKTAFAPFEYVCRRAAAPLAIDGRLNEPSWQEAEWTEVFGDIEGPAKPAPRFRTRAQMLWDDRYLYIGAYLEEPHVWATLTARDSIIFQDNDFEVFVDPDGDTHAYYELEMNALNTVWDLLLVKPYRDGGPAVHAWDIQGLKTGVRVLGTLNDPSDQDKAWTVEIALPFAVLRECIPGKPERPAAGDQWRVTFSRVEYRVNVESGAYAKVKDAGTGQPLPEDNWTWAPQGVINIHYPEMWGYVQFSARLPGAGRDKFERRPEEKVKWALREIYYAERALFAAKAVFAADLAALGLKGDGLRIKGWSWPPVLRATPSQFEAVYASRNGESWHIRQDGLVWKETPAKPAAK
jgi:hypothetical protein